MAIRERHNLRLLPLPVVLVFFTLLFSPGQQAWADELIMKDGSRLIGEVIKREGKTLEFKTSYAGVIKVKWDQVAELHAEKPVKLMLADESTVTTRHIKNNVEDLIIEGEAGAPAQTLGQSTVAYINPAPWRLGEGYRLTGHINFALEKERGNTDKDEIDIDGDLLWRRKNDRFKMFGEFERDRNNNKKTTDKWKTTGAYNYFLTKKWYAGAFLGFEHDQFADLNLRSIIGPLAGYQFFEGKEMNLSVELGPTWVDEDFENESDDRYIAAGWAINFDKFFFDEFVQFYHRQTGLLNTEDTGDLVWNTWTGLRFPLILGLVATTELQAEYDGGAAADADELDTTFSLKLGYQW